MPVVTQTAQQVLGLADGMLDGNVLSTDVRRTLAVMVPTFVIGATGSGALQLVFVNAETGEQRASSIAADETLQMLRISPDGRLVAAAITDNVVPVFDVLTGELRYTVTPSSPGDQIFSADFVRDSAHLTMHGYPAGPYIRGLDNVDVTWTPATTLYRYGIRSANNATLVVGSNSVGSDLIALSATNGAVVHTYVGQTEPTIDNVSDTAFTRVASISSADLCVWNATTVELLFRVVLADSTAVAISPDGTTVACALANHSIKLYNATTGAVLRTISARTTAVNALAFSRDGALLAAGEASGAVTLFVTSTGDTYKTFTVTGAVQAIDGAWTADYWQPNKDITTGVVDTTATWFCEMRNVTVS